VCFVDVAYRTLSIHVTDTLSHGVEATKGHVKEIADLEWHKIDAEDALHRLRCSPSQGLDGAQAQRRLQQDGKNQLSPPPTHRFRKMYSFRDLSNKALAISSAGLEDSCSLRGLYVSSATNHLAIPPRIPQIWPSECCYSLSSLFKPPSTHGKIGYVLIIWIDS
jgi:hypothetical protein